MAGCYRASPRKGRAVSRSTTVQALSARYDLRHSHRWRPMSQPPSGPASRAFLRLPEPTFPGAHQGSGFVDPGRLPPRGPAALALLSLCSNRTGCHSTFHSPLRAELPACDHAPSRGALDPTAFRLFASAEGPHAAFWLLQRKVPRARHRPVRPSAASVASHRSPNHGSPFGSPPTELSQVRGHLALIPRRPPPRRPLAAVDLPQPDRPGHPLSQNRVRSVVEFDPCGRPCGVGLFRTIPPEPLAFAFSSVGPPCMPSRERQRARPHPGCLRSLMPPKEAGFHVLPPKRQFTLPDAFFTVTSTELDPARSRCRLGHLVSLLGQ